MSAYRTLLTYSETPRPLPPRSCGYGALTLTGEDRDMTNTDALRERALRVLAGHIMRDAHLWCNAPLCECGGTNGECCEVAVETVAESLKLFAAATASAARAQGAAEEREACAVLAKSFDPYPDWEDLKGYCGDETLGAELELSRRVAAAIRARATEPPRAEDETMHGMTPEQRAAYRNVLNRNFTPAPAAERPASGVSVAALIEALDEGLKLFDNATSGRDLGMREEHWTQRAEALLARARQSQPGVADAKSEGL